MRDYVLYLGWFDGNPATLYSLPPVEESKKYVEFMGGANAMLAKAKESYNKGEYRWVAKVASNVVFADQQNKAARELEADALEQLGYQAESGPWRNFYLTGARAVYKSLATGVGETRKAKLFCIRSRLTAAHKSSGRLAIKVTIDRPKEPRRYSPPRCRSRHTKQER